MKIYINYPNPHFTLHWSDNCPEIRKHRKQRQRVIQVEAGNLDTVLSRFIGREFSFAATQDENDMWVDVSLATPAHDEALAYIVQAILGIKYAPFRTASIEAHSCSAPST